MKGIYSFYQKLKTILNRKQKIQFWGLLFLFTVSAFMELFGVSLIYPFIQAIINPADLTQNGLYRFVLESFPSVKEKETVFMIIIFIIAVYMLKNIILGITYYAKNKYIYNNQKEMACRLFGAYIDEPYEKHLNRNSAMVSRGITSDVLDFFTLLMNLLILFSHFMVCFVLILFLFLQDTILSFAIAGTLFIFFFVYTRGYRKKVRGFGDQSKKALGMVYQDVQETFSGIKDVKAYGLEAFFGRRLEKDYFEYSNAYRKYFFGLEIPRLILETLCVSIVLFVIFLRIQCEDSIIHYIPTLGVFAMALFRIFPRISEANECYNRILFYIPTMNILYQDLQTIEKETHEKEDETPILFKRDLVVQNVSFSYSNDKVVLREVSFKIEKGSTIAIVGASGKGKTTLVDIIMGLLNPQIGEVLLDGVNIKGKEKEFRKMVGYIPQNICFIDDTIRSNITIGLQNNSVIKDEQIWDILRIVNMEKEVKALPGGLDTVMGEQGVKFSGGQRQRLGIARALIKKPQIIILDEATSALDLENEKEVMDTISNLQGRITIIIISHRLSILKKCDMFYRIENETLLETKYDTILQEENCKEK